MEQQQETRLGRLQAIQAEANKPVSCQKCGSTWMFEAMFSQYGGGIYSSAPGGELKNISQMPQTIRMCMCGEPVPPNLGGVRGGRSANSELSSFLESLAKAQTARKMITDSINALVEHAAGKEALEQLAADVESMSKRIAALEAELASKGAVRQQTTTAVPDEAEAPVKEPKKGRQ